MGEVSEGAKVSGAMSRIWKVGSYGMGVKRMTDKRIVVPTAEYGAETWYLNAREMRRLNMMEKNCLKILATRYRYSVRGAISDSLFSLTFWLKLLSY